MILVQLVQMCKKLPFEFIPNNKDRNEKVLL